MCGTLNNSLTRRSHCGSVRQISWLDVVRSLIGKVLRTKLSSLFRPRFEPHSLSDTFVISIVHLVLHQFPLPYFKSPLRSQAFRFDGVTYALRPEDILYPHFSSWRNLVSVLRPKSFKKSRSWRGSSGLALGASSNLDVDRSLCSLGR